jgi:chaperone required for assembly of F1-ATPase
MNSRIARFYKEVAVERAGQGHAVLLDGKRVRTPARAELVLPNARLAEAIAGEWRAQTAKVDPAIMPLTRIANTAIDRIADTREPVIAEIAAYGKADLVCYRADTPDDLAAFQAKTWDPLLDWVEATHGARMSATRGLRFVPQSPEAVAALERAVAAHDEFGLAALHTAVTLLGSLVIALAISRGRLDAQGAYAAAHVDETYQAGRWGEDAEANARHAARETELEAAAIVLDSLRQSAKS